VDKGGNNITLYPAEDVKPYLAQVHKDVINSSFLVLIHGLSRSNGVVDDKGGVVGALLACLCSCDMEARKSLSRNIVICGGGASIPGENYLHDIKI
jgi:actin-related protein